MRLMPDLLDNASVLDVIIIATLLSIFKDITLEFLRFTWRKRDAADADA